MEHYSYGQTTVFLIVILIIPTILITIEKIVLKIEHKLTILFLLGWIIVMFSLSANESLLLGEVIYTGIIMFSIYSGFRFGVILLMRNQNRVINLLSLSFLYVAIQLLFGFLYYFIYVSNNSAFTFITTDVAERRTNIIESELDRKISYHRKMLGCQLAKELFISGKVIKKSEEASYLYYIEGKDKPFLISLMNQHLHMYSDPGGGYLDPTEHTVYFWKIDFNYGELLCGELENVIDSEKFMGEERRETVNPFETYSIAKEMYYCNDNREMIRLLEDAELIYQKAVSKIVNTIRDIDQNIIKANLIDFSLYSFNTASATNVKFLNPS